MATTLIIVTAVTAIAAAAAAKKAKQMQPKKAYVPAKQRVTRR